MDGKIYKQQETSNFRINIDNPKDGASLFMKPSNCTPKDENIDWDSTSTDFRSYDFEDMTDEEYEKMLRAADELFSGYNKKYKGKTKRVNGKGSMTLEQFKKELKKDRELTPEEKFELYYHERELRNNKLTSFDSMIKKLGLKKSKKNKK